MGIREDVLALADDVESTIGGCYGCLLGKRGLCKAESDFDCNDEVCKFVAHRLRAIAEKDTENVTTVSAYDLLPEDERKAIAWVREHGGLDEVEKRLMPEGMEWPTVDGKPVDFVTGYEPSLGVLEAVSIYSNGACEVMSHDGIVENATEIHVFKPKVVDADGVEVRVGDTVCGTQDMEPMRVVDADSRECGFKRIKCEKEGEGFFFYCADELTHKLPVLAADGKPLEVGQTVWHRGGNAHGVVESIDAGSLMHTVRYRSDDGEEYRDAAKDLTHQRPVLDADGVEIRVGDTVYVLGFGEPLTVKGFTDDGRVLMSFHDENSLGYKPSRITHEQPDTWERLEHDAEKTVCEYFGANYDCANCPLESARCAEEVKKDIIRRAKKLAERGA